MRFPLQSEKYHADFPPKNRWGTQMGATGWGPILCKIASFSPNFSVGEKCQKKNLWIFTPFTRWWFQICFIFIPTWGNDPVWRAYFSNGLKPPARFKLVGFTPFLWKKKFLPRNFPKGPISLWAAWQHVGPGSWGPELTWKPWVNGPILVGEEATDPTILNQNLKGSLVDLKVDLKVGTLMVNIAVNGMFFRPCLIRVLFQISSDGFYFFLAGIDSLPCCRWNRPMSKAFRLKYECIHHPLQCKRTEIRVENEHF